MSIFGELIQQVFKVFLFESIKVFLFFLNFQKLNFELQHRSKLQFFKSKDYDHLFEQAHNLDIFCSFRTKLQYFLQFDELLISQDDFKSYIISHNLL